MKNRLLISLICTFTPLATQAIEFKEVDNFLNCNKCHIESVLPVEHVALNQNDDCASCHNIDQHNEPKHNTSLRGKISLAHSHTLNGLSCNDCHQTEGDYPSNEQCFECHESYQKIAEQTAFLGHMNPHDSPHYQDTQTCDTCHYVHDKSEDLCLECHTRFRPIP
ncbi:cytochrome c3 family protein [Ferrimonas lipolytica]|uniref:Cytochrome c3 family protein n=1 Tax=Ferrimonas lipolytica TaxID=2724191 RepID=A0A6H1ULL1_9GAMM|nr:cytochrome c3 family protein [Ferrimonas lipolytica]QIZ78682.1 cytochrome c3 family protein [Ferrimonas lipolytica]